MPFANREAVADWLNIHGGSKIRLEAEGSTLKVMGMASRVERLDACSAEFLQCELDLGLPGLHASISLHPETLVLHFIGREAAEGRVALSVPVSLPYGTIHLSLVEDPASAKSTSLNTEEEVEYSPYELLFPRSD